MDRQTDRDTDRVAVSYSWGRTFLEVVRVVDMQVPAADLRGRYVETVHRRRVCLPEHSTATGVLVADAHCIQHNTNYYAAVTTMIRLRFDGRSTAYQRSLRSQQWCGPRPSVLGQDRSRTKKNLSWYWSCTSGVVLRNTVLSRSSS